MIDGVKIKKLRFIPDERGHLMEILRSDDEEFADDFGQCYITMAYPGVVKGWHYHKEQTDRFCIVAGMGKIALYDARDDSPTKGEVNEFFIGENNPCLLVIPPGVVHGMKAIGRKACYLLNIPDKIYDYDKPDEYRIDPWDNDIPYDWGLKEG